jgi:hypothetical protein
MLTLSIMACLLASPDDCKLHELQFSTEEGLTPYTCMMKSMPILAKWSEEHPQWKIEKWTCKYKKGTDA